MSLEKKMPIKKIISLFNKTENFIAYAALILLAIFPFSNVIAVKFFKTGVPGSTEYTHYLVLIVTFLGGMITTREGKHLSLSLNFDIKEPLKTNIKIIVAFFAIMVTTAFAWSSFSFILTAFEKTQKVGIISERLLVFVMVIGYLVMAIRFLFYVPKGRINRILASFGFLVGTIIALGSIMNIVSILFDKNIEQFDTIIKFSESLNSEIAIFIIVILILLSIFELPIFVMLGGVAYFLFANISQPLEIISATSHEMLTETHALAALPLFTLTGFILSESKASERLVKLFKELFSWIPGGMAIMAIIVSSFFTTFTGASGVTILALGALLYSVLNENQYKGKFSVGLLTSSGSVGLLFPPSLPIIMYGIIAGVSIKKMFLGGIIPGIVMVLALVIYGVYYANKKKISRGRINIKVALLAVRGAFWEILLPVVILFAFFGGWATLVESSAIAVIYAFIVEFIIHRDLKISELPNVIKKTLPIIGGILMILAVAKGLSYFIIDQEIPVKLVEWAKINIHSKYIFLLFLNIALLITGMFMDIFSAIMVVVPLILPLGELFGIAPVHLGIIFLANMELGYMTPPVGLNLFLASYRFNKPMTEIYKSIIPFFIIQLISVLLITYIPIFSMALL